MKGEKDTGYFHICTDGRALPWMFQDEKDFIAGINRIAICHLRTCLEIIAFVLMDNHVHFVLYGTMPQCKAFINLYKRLTGKWILTKYGIGDYLRGLPTEILRIENEESLLNTLAYLDRNPPMAGYRYMHSEYPWGSSKYLFRDTKTTDDEESWKPVSTYTRRALRSILNSKVEIPGNWLINESGMIHPKSFLNIRKLEACYKTPIRYAYFLAKKIEGIVEQDLQHSQKLFIPDKELRPIVRKMARELFSTENITELDVKDRLLIAKRLRYNYASTLKQISRMVHLSPTALDGFI